MGKIRKILIFVSTFGLSRCLNYIEGHYVYLLHRPKIVAIKVVMEG